MYDKIYNAIKKAVDSGVASGVNFLALKNGREIISCQYGYRDIENQKPMTRNTILRMYSTSKPVSLFLLLNKQRLNSRNRCQAATIIIEDLNLQKKFHTVDLFNARGHNFAELCLSEINNQ